MHSRRLDFNALLSPLSPDEFFAAYWQQKPLIHTAGAPERFSGLLSLSDVDYLVSSLTAAHPDWILLIKKAGALPAKFYSTKEQFVDLAGVYRAYEAGHTVLLTKLDRRWEPVGRLCRQLEGSFIEHGVALSKRILANMYLTPADAQAFPAHYDDHDTMILQLEGSKRWRIYGPIEPFPVEKQLTPQAADKLPPVQQEFTVEPGHVWYIPRGFYHDAQTSSNHSLHLTLGIYPYTWLDLVSKLLLTEPLFREALPAGCTSQGALSERLAEQFQQRVESLSQREDVSQFVQSLFNNLPDNLEALPDDGFRQLNNYKFINLDTLVSKHEGALAHTRRAGGEAQLIFSGSGFGGSEQLEPVFRFILDTDVFSARDLPLVPSDEIKLRIVRELIRDGLLRIMPT